MKLQTKIAILLGIIAFIFLLVVSLIQYAENKKTAEILAERKLEKLDSFEHTVLSVGKTLEVFSTDYTQWDEMVKFVYSKDPFWAVQNIEYSIKSFKTNVVWVYDKNFTQVYSFNDLDQPALQKSLLSQDKLITLLKKNYFNHFFVLYNNQLFEIRSAPIQPSEDVERIATPEGYFLVGKLWSNDVIEEISLLTSSKIELDSANRISNDFKEDIYKVKVSKELNDWTGKPLLQLTSTSDFSLLKKSSDVFSLQILLGIFLTISVLLSVGVFFFITIHKPLKIIYASLQQQNPALLVSASMKKNEFGKLAQLIIQFFNQKEKLIDEEKQRLIAESSLTKSEEKYKKIFDNVQDVFFQTDLNGVIVSVSPSIERYSEYKPAEILGKNILEYYLDPTVRLKFLNDLKTSGEVIDFEIYFVKKSGKILPCSVNAHLLYEEEKIIGIEGSLRDASERKKNEEQILKLSRVVEQSPISIIVTDIRGNIEYVNSKFEQVSGYTFEEVKNKSIESVRKEIISDEIFNELWKTLASGNEWSGELPSRTKNGDLGWENVFIIPIKNQSNEIINYVALKEDITEKKKIIEELKYAKEKAEEMNNIKSSFLANMSHELRTPMMGILGNAEIISLSTEDEEIKDMASAIYSSGRRLINTLNLILDLSRIEANKDNVDFEKLEVVPIIENVIEHFSSAAKQKKLSLTFGCNVKNIFSNLDERLFREVLNNLINNAIKFTNQGGVTVSLNAENEKMIIRIMDTGIGIAPHSLGLIFEEFRQASEGYGRSFEGTGLGLTITKKFVEKLGGKIFVKSVIDKGSEFTVELPIVKEYAND